MPRRTYDDGTTTDTTDPSTAPATSSEGMLADLVLRINSGGSIDGHLQAWADNYRTVPAQDQEIACRKADPNAWTVAERLADPKGHVAATRDFKGA